MPLPLTTPTRLAAARGVVLRLFAAAIFTAFWVRIAGRSLWIDEFGTIMALRRDFSFCLTHTWNTYQESPLYFILLYGWKALFGWGEIALRSFSILCCLGAAFLYRRLLARVGEPEFTRLATVFFMGSWGVFLSATNARPYALGLLFSVAACEALSEWLENGSRMAWWRSALCGAAAFYAHPLFMMLPLSRGALLVATDRNAEPARWRSWLFMEAVSFALLLPWLGRLASVWGQRGEVKFLATPSFSQFGEFLLRGLPTAGLSVLVLGGVFFFARQWRLSGRGWLLAGYVACATGSLYADSSNALFLIPHAVWTAIRTVRRPGRRTGHFLWSLLAVAALAWPVVNTPLSGHLESLAVPPDYLSAHMFKGAAAALILSLVAAGAALNHENLCDTPRHARRLWMLGAAWALGQPTAVFLVSTVTEAKLFTDHYLLLSALGLPVLTAGVFYAIRPHRTRWLAVIAALALQQMAMARLPLHYFTQDWRSIAANANAASSGSRELFLIDPGYIEATQPAYLSNPLTRENLLAPFLYYPVRATAVVVPWMEPYNRDEMPAYLRQISPTMQRARAGFLSTAGYTHRRIEQTLLDVFPESGFEAAEWWVRGSVELRRWREKMDEKKAPAPPVGETPGP